MEVWVRSQDKNRFAKANIFSYDYEVNRHIVNCNGYPYGVYNSKERCLEIIDEIQLLLENNGSTNDRISQAISGIKNEFIVYEMPKE